MSTKQTIKTIVTSTLAGVLVLTMAACSADNTPSSHAGASPVEPAPSSKSIKPVSPAPKSSTPKSDDSYSYNTDENDANQLSVWDEKAAPNYYLSTGKANLPANLVPAGTIEYQGIDSLGRTGWAHGNINWSMVEKSAGWRAKFDSDVDEISGWKNPDTGKSNNGKAAIVLDNGKTYHGYFYNRSHLIADSLGGAPSRKNLVTGTRMQNVGDNSANPGGMAYTETLVRNLLKKNHDATVVYYVHPVYNGDEIVPRGTVVDVKSSDGSLDQHVLVWNYAKGYSIDYTTGAWNKD